MKINTLDRKHKFTESFNTENGFYIRSGVFRDGKETEEDPFMRSYPGLIDVGIMGSCDHAHLCSVGCYQGGLNNQKPNMSFKDYKSIVDQSRGKVFQIALGGHGDPNKHEHFEEILKYTRANNIVPNYTTSGLGLTDKEVELTKKYCGAVAVSMYNQDHTYEALAKFIDAGCTTNIHYVLSNKTIDNAIMCLRDTAPDDTVGLNAIIFLTYKPVGCGVQEDVLDVNDPRLREFCKLIEKPHPFKVGFDSCFIPALVNFANINFDSVDTCEGARYSAYISSDMVMIPCSFDQDEKWGCDLNTMTIQQSWDSESFDSFRDILRSSCSGCGDQKLCGGGCAICREIVLCNRKEKELK